VTRSNAASLIRLEGICKSFGRVAANKDISLDIRAGRIKALLGENGAGKSTLMSILSGRLHPDRGDIYIDGRRQLSYSTQQALDAGIGMVYQHFMLVTAMTAAENIFLGMKDRRWLSPGGMADTVDRLARRFGLTIDPNARVENLSMGERQRVEILKLLWRRSRVLIFDEPTAVLTPPEIDQLFEALRQMADQGKAIVFISHKLAEVTAIADEIAILRKGALVDQMDADAVTSKADLARRMVGREVMLTVDRVPMAPKQRVLHIDGLSDDVLHDVHLSLRQGEILGLVGVAGNGQRRLVEIICGLHAPPGPDRIRILGLAWRDFFAQRRWDGALSYIPEDRQGLATCLNLDLTDNFLLTTREGFSIGPWLMTRRAGEKTAELVRQFGVTPSDVRIRARQLSGGNLQKMVLSREFYRRPRLIVAEQPTQGLDIGATEDVWNILLKARQRAGILLVTGDLKEALSLSDRIAVIASGRIMDVFASDDVSKRDQIGALMAGCTPPECC
jgi:simple sugar transport system ATP-binding protein